MLAASSRCFLLSFTIGDDGTEPFNQGWAGCLDGDARRHCARRVFDQRRQPHRLARRLRELDVLNVVGIHRCCPGRGVS
jgi:hypothetical protein